MAEETTKQLWQAEEMTHLEPPYPLVKVIYSVGQDIKTMGTEINALT